MRRSWNSRIPLSGSIDGGGYLGCRTLLLIEPGRENPAPTSAQCHALQALQLAHGADLLGLDRARKSFAHVPRAGISEGVFYVYVLRSESDSGFYIGYSSNLRIRLWQHQDGRSRATSYRGPWRLIYYEAYLHQADALGREKYLKSGGGRRFLKAQLRHYLAEGSPGKPRRRAVA